MKPLFQWVYASPPSQATAAARSAAEGQAISNRIEQAFDTASNSTGTSFEYLLETAKRESALDPKAKAATSTASGLFQFIESTWLETLKRSGPELGLGALADKIERGADGRYRVPDPQDRRDILALRNDPDVASMMAGALTRTNAAYLQGRIGRDPTEGELYIAHFLGARGAADMISLAQSKPNAAAAEYFPRQAGANPSIFYGGGRALTVAQVYDELVKNHGGSVMPAADSAVITAFANPVAGDAAVPVGYDPRDRVQSGWKAAEAGDAFSALFRDDGSRQAGIPAASFWQGYTMPPSLFDVAVAEDARVLSAEQPDVPVPNSASIAARANPVPRSHGPLDLSKFLNNEEG